MTEKSKSERRLQAKTTADVTGKEGKKAKRIEKERKCRQLRMHLTLRCKCFALVFAGVTFFDGTDCH